MTRLVTSLLAVVLVAAACGDAATSDTTRPPETTASSEPPTTTSTVPPATTAPTTEPPAVPPAEPAAFSPSAGVTRAEPDSGAPVAELVAGLNDAGFDLWRTQSTSGNLVFSPVNVGQALLMARPAADDPTGAAIDAAFGLPAGTAAHEAWNALETAVAASAAAEAEVDVRNAARLWPAAGVHPDQGWIDLLAAQHGATLESLDFAGDPEGARQTINDWVADATEGLIPNLLPEGSVDPDTALTLTNALYFKARWNRVFGKYAPETGPFTRPDGTTVDVSFLRELEMDDVRGAGDGFVGAEIPYAGREFSMLVIVPDAGRFDEVRGRIGQGFLDEVDATFTTGPYELLIPEWGTTSSVDLLEWLAGLGIAPGAFPGIAPGVFLDAAVHGAEIHVDEWGTVAAAASALSFATSGPPEPELVVRADRPFLYLIRHRPSGAVLFAGQVTDPTG